MKNIMVRNAALALLTILVAATMLSCDDEIIQRYQTHYLPNNNNQAPSNGTIKVTFLGTSMLLFDDGQTKFLIDGFITRPSLGALASPIRTNQNAVNTALTRAGIGPGQLAAIFTAHSHYDHVLDVAYIAQRTGAKLYGSDSTLNVGRGGGLPESQMALSEHGTEVFIGQFVVTVLKSKHSPPPPLIPNDEGQVIAQPLNQPRRFGDFKEGGSFDIRIKHVNGSILVKPSANYIPGALDNVRADVLFLSTGNLGRQNLAFRNAYYNETVAKVRPRLVIPIHWDNFFKKLSNELEATGDTPDAFDFLINRLQTDNIRFGILQGYQSVILFNGQIP